MCDDEVVAIDRHPRPVPNVALRNEVLMKAVTWIFAFRDGESNIPSRQTAVYVRHEHEARIFFRCHAFTLIGYIFDFDTVKSATSVFVAILKGMLRIGDDEKTFGRGVE